MKYTNTQVISIYEKLTLVYKSQIAFPAKVAYCIVRNLNTLAPIYEDIMRARNDLIRSNSEQLEDENCYRILPEKREYLDKEFSSLGSVENEISWLTIKMKDIEAINLPIDIMDGLFCMIEDESK